MARKTKEDALKTRETILDSAVEVFSRKGVSRSTLADIAKEAGVTRGAIYWHFDNKAALLEELWQRVILPFEPIDLLSRNRDEPDPLGKLQLAYVNFFKLLENDPKMLKLLQVLFSKCEMIADVTGDLQFFRQNSHQKGREIVAEVLRNAIRQRQLPPDIDVRMGSIATIAFIDGLVANWTMSPHVLDVDREIPTMLRALFIMLSSGFTPPPEEIEIGT